MKTLKKLQFNNSLKHSPLSIQEMQNLKGGAYHCWATSADGSITRRFTSGDWATAQSWMYAWQGFGYKTGYSTMTVIDPTNPTKGPDEWILIDACTPTPSYLG